MQIITEAHKISTPIVATIGMFDGVHLGHQSLIEQVQAVAQSRGMQSAVVTFASHPCAVLRPQVPVALLTHHDERMAHLAETGIDYVIVLNFDKELSQYSASQFIEMLHNDYNMQVLCVGYDHRFGHNRSEGFAEYRAHGEKIGVEVVEAKPFLLCDAAVSSSAIRKALRACDIRQANLMLGYNYTIAGKVVEGRKLGRTIGFPTANIDVNSIATLIPGGGVYAIRATLDDASTHMGMMNIGYKPTVEGCEELSIEAHLFDFSGDLYGREVKVELVAFMRNEKRYDNIHALEDALTLDAIKARKILTES